MMLVHLISLITEWAVRMGEIFLCDTDVSRGIHVQKVDESLQRAHSLASQVCLQLSLPKVFSMFLLRGSGHSSS